MWSYEVPNNVFEKLIGGFVADTARFMLENRRESDILHPGDLYGQVLAWLWKADASAVIGCTADLLAQLRYHAKGADRTITLDELLTGIRFATHDMPASDADELISRLRAGVPGYFDADVTSKPGEG